MLEVCVDSLHGAREAVQAGAQRIEISCRLEVGGVTPDRELVCAVRKEINVPLIALVRCREGDFCYSPEEKSLMLEQVGQMIEFGCDGVALGACDSRLGLDEEFFREAGGVARREREDCELVVHRVFDAVPEKCKSLEKLISIGYNRVLTSGGGLYAVDSLEMLRDLQRFGSGRISLLPAGGVHSGNAMRILQVTGCRELHGSFTKRFQDESGGGRVGQGGRILGSPIREEVEQVRAMLDQWLGQS